MEVNFTVMCFQGVFTHCQARNLVPFFFLEDSWKHYECYKVGFFLERLHTICSWSCLDV